MKKCIVCATVLTGKQRKFCSRKCQNRDYNLRKILSGKSKESQKRRVIRRKIKYTSVQAYEEKLFNIKIPKMYKDPNCLSTKTGQLKPAVANAIAINERWHSDRINNGFVKKLFCKRCEEIKCYTSFMFAKTNYGRDKVCKKCRAIENANKAISYEERRKKWVTKDPAQKFRTIVGVQIRRDISSHRNEYAKDLSIPDIWDYIEKNLGYNSQDFCDHLESQFDKNMKWENHGRGYGQYRWQMDHIIPRSNFKYTKLTDPEFAKCWSLENIRPLEAFENIRRFYEAG